MKTERIFPTIRNTEQRQLTKRWSLFCSINGFFLAFTFKKNPALLAPGSFFCLNKAVFLFFYIFAIDKQEHYFLQKLNDELIFYTV